MLVNKRQTKREQIGANDFFGELHSTRGRKVG